MQVDAPRPAPRHWPYFEHRTLAELSAGPAPKRVRPPEKVLRFNREAFRDWLEDL
jgi:hypothetical protein